MLLWEALAAIRRQSQQKTKEAVPAPAPRSRRLPYDKRCAAITKSGHRCRGKIREGLETCLFHDPAWREQLRLKMANGLVRRRRRLSHLPDGYLKKLSNRASVGNAMDRLYREIRLGLITPQMGSVMFSILTRLMDSGLLDAHAKALTADGGVSSTSDLSLAALPVVSAKRRMGKADKLRPRLQDLLTRSERTAWRKAVSEAPEAFLLTENGKQPLPLIPVPGSRPATEEQERKAIARVRQTAS